MRYLFLILLLQTISFGQKKAATPIDSTAYYVELANSNKKINNYKSSLYFSQKAINYALIKGNVSQKSEALYSLGSTYYELKKYNDAVDVFSKCAGLLSTIPSTSQQAFCYFDMGMCYMNLDNLPKAELNFNKAQALYHILKIDTFDPLKLQKAILYKNKGELDVATKLLNQIISKPDNEDVYKTKAEALYQMGCIEESLNHNSLAVNYLNRALILNSEDENLEQKAAILLSLSRTNEKLLALKKSHAYLKAHLSLKDSLTELSNQKLDADGFQEFKESEHIKAIGKITKENEALQKTNKFITWINFLKLAFMCILVLLCLSLYKNNLIRTQTNDLLNAKNIELQRVKDKADKDFKARAEFISIVSHELRSPLNAINGITHLLLEDHPKHRQLHFLNSMKFSGNHLLTLINEILEINRIDSSNIEIECINFNLKQLLRNIQDSMKEIASTNNNKFTLEIDPNIPEVLLGDPTKMSQIFINLINNALKFTQNGEVSVVVKLVEQGDSFSQINFAINDTGIGIAEEQQKTIFDSFSQGSIETNRKYGGTGLGLTIGKKTINLLGGKIYLKSAVGVGSSFTFELNFLNGNQEIKPDKNHTYSNDVLVGKNVLVVEDDTINQMVTKKMLKNKGMKCTIIDNGEEAIEAIKADNDFDLVLMDIHLPGITGSIATQNIREFNTKIPIIALTAISVYESREMLLSFGMTDVITKPFEPEDFYRVIALHLTSILQD